MTAVEAVLLLIGVVFFVGSFFITEKLSSSDVSRVAELSQEELHMVVDRELETAGAKISDMVDDAMDLTIDKVQRTMERDTNEKIMAISEYSDSVREQLEKMNHEVTFLYSMLGDKHTQLNETMEQLDELLQRYQTLREQPLPEPASQPVVVQMPETMPQNVQQTQEPAEQQPVTDAEHAQEEPADAEQANVRAQILERYHAGEDLTDIARNLGVGFGEVKLIVELYRGEEA